MTSFTHRRRLIRVVAAPLVIAGLAVTVACSQPEGAAVAQPPTVAADGTQQVTLRVGNSMDFSPRSVAVSAGTPVQVTLQNTGNMPHDFTLTSGVETPVKITTNGGQTGQDTFTIQQPGTYTFICSVSGHESAGMRGTLRVQ